MPAPTTPSSGVMPSGDADTVTPGTQLGGFSRALYVGGAGNVVVTMRGGGNVTFFSVPAGSILPISTRLVVASGTTATNIIALY